MTLQNTGRITLDLRVRRLRFMSPATRSFGDAEIFIPRSSSAFSTAYVREQGGSYVRIDDAVLGTFEGIAQPPAVGDGGATLQVYHLGWLLKARLVSRNRVFTAQTAGAIVRQALVDGLAGLGQPVLRIGSIVEAAPVISSYEFTGQDVASVLGDMQDFTGSEWSISNGAVSWVPPVSSLYSYHLCDDGDLLAGTLTPGTLDDQAAEVIGRDTLGREYRARDGEVFGGSFWQRQVLLTVDSTYRSALGVDTEAALAARRNATLTFRAGLLARSSYTVTSSGATGDEAARGLGLDAATVAHWSTIREGSILLLHLPHAGFSGASPVCRVLSREYTEGARYLDLELQWLPTVSATSRTRLEASRAVPSFVVPEQASVVRRLLATEKQLAAASA